MYPFVVIRWMAAVYGHRSVKFVPSGPVPETDDDVIVVCPNPYVDGVLSEQAKLALIERLKQLTIKMRLRLCAVFSAESAVYVETDGTASESTTPPCGGVMIKIVRRRKQRKVASRERSGSA